MFEDEQNWSNGSEVIAEKLVFSMVAFLHACNYNTKLRSYNRQILGMDGRNTVKKVFEVGWIGLQLGQKSDKHNFKVNPRKTDSKQKQFAFFMFRFARYKSIEIIFLQNIILQDKELKM